MKWILSFLLFFTITIIAGQVNLVPNYSFEIFSQCPDGWNKVSYLENWKSYCASPDYFNSCDSINSFGVPTNVAGFQNAFDGAGYCGFVGYSFNPLEPDMLYREHIGTQLISSLIIGKKYCCYAKVAFTYNSNFSNCANNNIGIKFSTISYEDFGVDISSPAINNFAHIYSNQIITDTANWTTISGFFIADSTYDYIILGNFFDNNNTDSLLLDSNNYCYSYYYIDDVSVILCDTVGMIEEQNKNYLGEIFPNPVRDKINFTNNFTGKNICIVNMVGQKMYSGKFEKELDVSFLPTGIYVIEIANREKIFRAKFAKE